jgi:hypothetical protein
MNKKLFYTLFMVLMAIGLLSIIGTNLFADGIKWLTSYDKAIAEAKKVDKNVFVLITAPSWCYYCQILEKNVLSVKKVQDYINDGFVPLMITDTNPDVDKFEFEGYPTVQIFNKDGKKLAEPQEIYEYTAESMIKGIEKYAKLSNSTTVTTTTVSFSDSFKEDAKKYGEIENNIWTFKNEHAIGIVNIAPIKNGMKITMKSVTLSEISWIYHSNDITLTQGKKVYKCTVAPEGEIIVKKDAPSYWTFTIEKGWDMKKPFDFIEAGKEEDGCFNFKDVKVK